MNAFIRFKLALTENSPVIKPYEESKWAMLDDGIADDVTNSLEILKHLHTKWVVLLKSMKNEDFQRDYIHPELGKRFQLIDALAMYSWHGRHHSQHIKQALKYQGNF